MMYLKNCRLVAAVSDGLALERADIGIENGKIVPVAPVSGAAAGANDIACCWILLMPMPC